MKNARKLILEALDAVLREASWYEEPFNNAVDAIVDDPRTGKQGQPAPNRRLRGQMAAPSPYGDEGLQIKSGGGLDSLLVSFFMALAKDDEVDLLPEDRAWMIENAQNGGLTAQFMEMYNTLSRHVLKNRDPSEMQNAHKYLLAIFAFMNMDDAVQSIKISGETGGRFAALYDAFQRDFHQRMFGQG